MLRSLWQGGSDIQLIPNSNVPIGRTPETGIISLKCPRRHLDIVYDPISSTATVRRATTRPRSFGVNGEKCVDQAVIKSGDVLQVLRESKYEYRFEIPAMEISSTVTVKRTESVKKVGAKGDVVLLEKKSIKTVVETVERVGKGWTRPTDASILFRPVPQFPRPS